MPVAHCFSGICFAIRDALSKKRWENQDQFARHDKASDSNVTLAYLCL